MVGTEDRVFLVFKWGVYGVGRFSMNCIISAEDGMFHPFNQSGCDFD